MKKLVGIIVVVLAIFLLPFPTSSAEGKTIHWSEEKQVVYNPLYLYTLPWSDEVMKFGGYDFEEEKIVSDGAKADIVINQYGSLGSRKIAKLTSFGQPVETTSIQFLKDGLGYPLYSVSIKQGDIYLIEDSDGKYVQLRIDQIGVSTVHFTYIEEQQPGGVEDPTQFTELEKKYSRDVRKPWTVTFSHEVNPSTITQQSVYVKYSKGYVLDVDLRVSNDQKKVYIIPLRDYGSGEYKIFVTKEVKSKTGQQMSKGAMMTFTMDETGIHPDQTAPKIVAGLGRKSVNDEIRLTWTANSETDLAGYHVYYRIVGKDHQFAPLPNVTTGKDLFFSTEISLVGFEYFKNEKVEFYVTAVDRDNNESIPSEFLPVTFEEPGAIDEEYIRYIDDWILETSLASFGQLSVNRDGTYRWSGGLSGTTTGHWEIRDYGFVLVNADSGYDYVIQKSDRNPEHIKLLYVDGTWNDGSPMLIYHCEGK